MGLEDAANEVDAAITRSDLKGLAYENTFAGVTSFLRRKYTKDLTGVDLAITGIPFDQAVTNRPGTRFGPRAVREASTLMPTDPPFGWDYNALNTLAIADYGDMSFDYAKVHEIPNRIEAHIESILAQGAAAISIGGDHSVSLPILRAHAKRHGPLALLQFDAHSDTWDDDDDTRIDHGTMFTKAVREGLIDTERSVQVGIRTTNEDTRGIHTLDAREVHLTGPVGIAARIKHIVGDGPVYLSFDIDALDPAYAPGTGTPVWGGLTSAQAWIILRDLAGINLVGGDVVEVSPPFDHANITAIAGAHVALMLISIWGWQRDAR